MSRRRLLGLLCVLVALPAAGCGFGSGESTGDVSLNVTRDFGGERLHEGIEEHATEGDTVMRLLERNYKIDTRYGGGFVQDIEGVGGGREDGRRVDWFYYVNGIEASIGAAERRVAAGERVWWDHHAWEAAQRVPAVVGSFPEPFKSGLEGKRFPVRLVCVGDAERSCDEVTKRLEDSGVKAVSRSVLEQSAGEEVLRVVVGRWADVRRDTIVRRLESGPSASGVFARPTSTGDAIVLLDAEGQPVRTLRAGAGLVAATSVEATGADVDRDRHRRCRRRGGVRGAHRGASGAALRPCHRRRPGRAAAGQRRGGRAMTYRRRASPLHAARAGVGAIWCVTLGLVALSFEHPLPARGPGRGRARRRRGRARRARRAARGAVGACRSRSGSRSSTRSSRATASPSFSAAAPCP